MIRKLLVALLALSVFGAAHAEVFQATYGVAKIFPFKLYNADGTLDVDESDGGTEVSLSCNQGAETTATNDFVDEGTHYSISLTAAEMQCQTVVVVVAATTTEVFFIQTSGNASAFQPTLEANVASASTGSIDNADFATAPGAAGGLQIAGSNAATTYATLTVTGATAFTGNVTMPAGLNITQSVSNTPALVITGNGTGNGATITSGSGATGTGLAVVSAATNGSAVTFAGVGTGNGLASTGGATGHGISAVGGATSGNGIRATGTAGNSVALNLIGQGSAAGLLSTGGATGHGISAVGGATSGAGISSVATTSGAGIVATGVGTTQAGIAATGGATSSPGISAAGGGTGAGILTTGGATGHGLSAVGGATSGDGVRSVATAGNSNAMNLVGQGSANGLLTTGGATGHGISAVGGATSGNGVRAAGTAGNSDALNLIGQGSANGLLSTGGVTGHGFRLVGGATSGNGLSTSFTAPSSGACEVGYCNSGTLSGTHSATTADLGTLAPTTISDLPSMTLVFPTRNLSRAITSYDTATGIATFATIDADITLTNGDPWILWTTAPGSAGSGATAAEVWAYSTRILTALDEDTTSLDLNGTTIGTVTTATTATTLTNLPTIPANWLTAAGTATDFTTEVTSGLATAASIAAIPVAIRDTVIEDQGGGITLGCALAIAAAYAAGDVVTTGANSTYEESSGTETRIAGTVASAGNRTATITCPSY